MRQFLTGMRNSHHSLLLECVVHFRVARARTPGRMGPLSGS